MNEELVTLQLKELARQLRSHGYSEERMLQLIAGDESIPATVFSTATSPLQALVSYLKNNQGLSLGIIAKKLQRTYRAVWGSYHEEQVLAAPTTHYLPVSIFNDRLSILEAAVMYLKDIKKLKYSQIARLLNKDDRTVWTTYQRGVKKHEHTKKRRKR